MSLPRGPVHTHHSSFDHGSAPTQSATPHWVLELEPPPPSYPRRQADGIFYQL